MELVIASGIGAEFDAQLRVRVPGTSIRAVIAQTPWDISPEATVVLVTPSPAWRDAPEAIPTSWGRVNMLMSMSAGMDMYPRWVLDVPVISCGRGFTSDVIAEYVLGAMLNHEKGFLRHRVRSSSAMETSWVGSLKGATLGIAGFGSIGGEVARRALAFGMNIRAYRRSDTALPDGIKAAASLRDLAGFSDHLVIAMPLTEETRKSIGRKVFQAAKPGLHLVNVSRGAILDLDALRRSLETGTVAAATLDVTDPEPLPEGHWAYGDERFIITPHMSWQGGAETEARKLDTLAENLRRIMDGREILNRFDACRGY